MDAHVLLLQAMVKCAIRHNPKDINEWGDQKTYSGMARDMSVQLAMDGICLQKWDLSGDEPKSESDLTNDQGE
jgi:hypothetical protein